MAIAPVLKTGVRKDLGVRIPRPPLELQRRSRGAVLAWATRWANLRAKLERATMTAARALTCDGSRREVARGFCRGFPVAALDCNTCFHQFGDPEARAVSAATLAASTSSVRVRLSRSALW